MTRVTTAFAAALALFMPIGRPLLLGLTPVVGIGAGLLTTQAAFAQTAIELFNSGLDKAKSGNLKGAITDWTKAIEIDPKYADAYYNRGVVKHDLKDYRGAIADYTKAIKYYPNDLDAGVYDNRGGAKYELKDYQGAISDYTKAIQINSNYAKAYTNRGVVLGIVGDLKGSCRDWKKAVDLGDTRPIEWVRNEC
ncbi:tetratricopeptide repeat protein [Synechococcus sp. MIT S1220]|uniref:tetratricopeptide repeat protein n=1 Tax=Synechococcus sp. MIT S1220 TaxID=3082549 RepID=UPI0039AFE85B